MASIKDKVAKGAVWATLEKFVLQGVHFVVGMVLARLLTPTDYGTVALLSIFFAIAGTFVSCGFGTALVQRKEVGELEFNSVFYTSIAMSIVIYAIFFFTAPLIAEFYDVPVLKAVVRVSALSFVFGAINSVQCAELSRKMLFDRRFKISLATCLASAVCGITFAFLGWGVWAIVLSGLMTNIVGMFAYWFIIAWRPRLMFSFSALKGLFSYGWKMSLAGLVHTTYTNLSGFLIGKFYSPADLAFVNKGQSMPNLLMTTIDGTINSVSFPAMAQLQDRRDSVRNGLRRMIQCSTYLVFPLLAGLCICAKPMIVLLYGTKWSPAVPYVMIACVDFLLLPFNTINTNAISAIGRSDVYLLLDCIKKTVGVLVTIVSLRYGILTFMLATAFIQSPFAVFVNTFANGRILGYNLSMQMRDVLSPALLTAAMSAVVLAVQFSTRSLLAAIPCETLALAVELLLAVVVGTAVYIGLSVKFKPQPFLEYLNVIQPVLRTKFPRVARVCERIVC